MLRQSSNIRKKPKRHVRTQSNPLRRKAYQMFSIHATSEEFKNELVTLKSGIKNVSHDLSKLETRKQNGKKLSRCLDISCVPPNAYLLLANKWLKLLRPLANVMLFCPLQSNQLLFCYCFSGTVTQETLLCTTSTRSVAL